MKTKMKFVSSVFIILVACSWNNLRAQESIEAAFESNDNKVVITYALKGQPDVDYDVSVVLKKQSDPAFIMYPDDLEGDYGKGAYSGDGRKIYWEPDEDEIRQLYGDDYYFEISAGEASGGAGWYIVLGGVIIAGSAAAIVFSTK